MAKCLEMFAEPLAQVNWGHTLRRECSIYGISKSPQRLKVISPAGTSFQKKGRLRRLMEECHPPTDAPGRLASGGPCWP